MPLLGWFLDSDAVIKMEQSAQSLALTAKIGIRRGSEEPGPIFGDSEI
jgi:hypothetical protein